MAGRTRRSLRALALPALLFFWACAAPGAPPEPAPGSEPSHELEPRLDAEGHRWVNGTLAGLTLREQAAQLVFPWVSGAYASTTSPEFLDLMEQVETGVGGLLVSIGLPHSYAAKLNELQRRAAVPLLVSSDFESGGPGMRMSHIFALPSLLSQGGGTSFPPTMAFGAIGDERFARELGRVTGEEARAVGVHLNFAPVLDVNSNPRNPVINTRSFGGDARLVADLGAAFIRGSREGGVLTTAKHFPGHGDTGTDSHIDLPVVRADRTRLDTLELVPFRRAVEAGVDGVMTAHVVVPGVLGEDAPPATFSPYFLDRLLRREMGFDGLVLTDALRMGAITGGYGAGEAAVRALEAGSDVLLAPADVEATVDAVVAAVASGRISRARLEESVRRILELKARVGLHRRRTVSVAAVDEVVGSGPHLAFADSAATRSITLVRDREGLVPLRPDSVESVLSITWTRPGDQTGSRAADAALTRRFPGAATVRLDEERGRAALDSTWNAAWRADRVLVNPFVAYRAGTGTIGLSGPIASFVQRLAVHRPVVVTSFGNPYVLESFPGVGTYMLAWGGREVSQEAAVRAWTGEAAVTGRLPISLPPYHEIGDGLHREAVTPPPAVAGGVDELDEAGIVAVEGEGEVVGDEGGGARLPDLQLSISRAEADAIEAGMSEDSLARLDAVVLDALADSAAPGAVLAVGRGDRLVRLRGYGRTDWDPDAPPATPTTLYDLASLTKVVATTTAAMGMVEEGRLSLDDRVVEHLPWWSAGDERKEEVTVRQLLLHRSGLPSYERFFLEISGRAAYERAIGNVELEYDPGTRYQYSDIGMMTLAFVIEAVAERSLPELLDGEVWTPLGMTDTAFRPDSTLLPRIAPTERDTLFRHTHVHGVVHDENAYAIGGVAGHAGLFSTASDLAVFAHTMLAGGELEPCPEPGPSSRSVACTVPWSSGTRIVADSLLRSFTRRAGHEGSSRALGWDTPSGTSSAGDYFTASAYGHTGFTGTSIWIDAELDLFVVLLTNRVNPTRDNTRHVELRRRVHDLAATAITDRPVEPRP